MITKSIIFWISLILSYLADAQMLNTNNDQRVCTLLSDMTYWIAQKRDENVDRFEIRNFFMRESEGQMLQTFLALTDLVYQRPHYTPREEANNYYTQCMEGKGDPT